MKCKTSAGRRRKGETPFRYSGNRWEVVDSFVVAEHRGVVLLRIPGYKLAVLTGGKHSPEDHVCLIRRIPSGGRMQLIGLPTEASAKTFLDKRSQKELKEFVSLCELAELAGLRSITRQMLSKVKWKWNEVAQSFVESGDRFSIVAEAGMGRTALQLSITGDSIQDAHRKAVL